MMKGEISMKLTQEEKAVRLQHAVINCSIQEFSAIYDELGSVEITAPALGLACRFRGLQMVKALVEKGATFDFLLIEEIAIKYNCYVSQGDSHINYSRYLLKIPKEGIMEAFGFRGMTLEQSIEQDSGEVLSVLSDTERVAVLQFLLEQREKIAFQPEDILYYAIFFKDTTIYKALKESGVKLTEVRAGTIADSVNMDIGCWYEYNLMMKHVSAEDCLEVFQRFALEIEGKKFRCTDWTYGIIRKHFHNKEIALFFISNFQSDKMNKTEIMRGFIDANAVEALAVIAGKGWLSMPSKRDKMIDYASQNGRTEALAWLLDFKNRTADFALEQKRADQKLMRALNAAPDSVTTLKTLWNYKKNEKDTLTITNYKGQSAEVIVPEKIGKRIVTEIGQGAFPGNVLRSGVANEQLAERKEITKIVLPETIEFIGASAFSYMNHLREINIPDGVKQIENAAFYKCSALRKLSIPEQVTIIPFKGFGSMTALEELYISGPVQEIGQWAFDGCISLKRLVFQGNVEKIGAYAFMDCKKLEEICIGERAIEIGEYAFCRCTSLKSFIIPGTLKEVKRGTFSDCQMLESVQISEGVEVIAETAFCGCSSLKTIEIPSSVKVIKKDAFLGCERLEKVYLNEGVEDIRAGAFAKCTNLKEVILPKSVQRIKTKRRGFEFDTFEECPKLTVICIAGSRAEAYCKRKGLRFLYS